MYRIYFQYSKFEKIEIDYINNQRFWNEPKLETNVIFEMSMILKCKWNDFEIRFERIWFRNVNEMILKYDLNEYDFEM